MKKHIVCFGDSNTHGYCADPADCADGGDRFNEEERWPCRLQKALGEDRIHSAALSSRVRSGKSSSFSLSRRASR